MKKANNKPKVKVKYLQTSRKLQGCEYRQYGNTQEVKNALRTFSIFTVFLFKNARPSSYALFSIHLQIISTECTSRNKVNPALILL